MELEKHRTHLCDRCGLAQWSQLWTEGVCVTLSPPRQASPSSPVTNPPGAISSYQLPSLLSFRTSHSHPGLSFLVPLEIIRNLGDIVSRNRTWASGPTLQPACGDRPPHLCVQEGKSDTLTCYRPCPRSRHLPPGHTDGRDSISNC